MRFSSDFATKLYKALRLHRLATSLHLWNILYFFNEHVLTSEREDQSCLKMFSIHSTLVSVVLYLFWRNYTSQNHMKSAKQQDIWCTMWLKKYQQQNGLSDKKLASSLSFIRHENVLTWYSNLQYIIYGVRYTALSIKQLYWEKASWRTRKEKSVGDLGMRGYKKPFSYYKPSSIDGANYLRKKTRKDGKLHAIDMILELKPGWINIFQE